jgi:hypothetical protein
VEDSFAALEEEVGNVAAGLVERHIHCHPAELVFVRIFLSLWKEVRIGSVWILKGALAWKLLLYTGGHSVVAEQPLKLAKLYILDEFQILNSQLFRSQGCLYSRRVATGVSPSPVTNVKVNLRG